MSFTIRRTQGVAIVNIYDATGAEVCTYETASRGATESARNEIRLRMLTEKFETLEPVETAESDAERRDYENGYSFALTHPNDELSDSWLVSSFWRNGFYAARKSAAYAMIVAEREPPPRAITGFVELAEWNLRQTWARLEVSDTPENRIAFDRANAALRRAYAVRIR